MKNVSHETIYKFIYSKEGQKLNLYQHLICRRPERQAKFSRVKRYQVPEEKRIENRPEAINNRSEFGHGEADLTFFKGSNSKNVITTIERVSRMVRLANNNDKQTEDKLNNLPRKCLGYLTPKQHWNMLQNQTVALEA